ncbi:hypothetical protein PV327_010406 [Microctonus hyperodae]|uniref:Uncharacterized protein n=1 Tax=Microctonus hyperodae TaxID=165561 RepID=A0AA39KV07_MICHY|nr:hypothetical protein PV327_010406 [Microctonus hyperodae]
MLKAGAWCAGIVIFAVLTIVCVYLAHRVGRMSRVPAVHGRSSPMFSLPSDTDYDVEHEVKQSIATPESRESQTDKIKKQTSTTNKAISENLFESLKVSPDGLTKKPKNMNYATKTPRPYAFPTASVLMPQATESIQSK